KVESRSLGARNRPGLTHFRDFPAGAFLPSLFLPMILLGMNIDHCATLRQARYRDATDDVLPVEPDPVEFALQSERAGADGITVHLREDRRHIQERDVRRLRERIG